jgi:hypothetical protein
MAPALTAAKNHTQLAARGKNHNSECYLVRFSRPLFKGFGSILDP